MLPPNRALYAASASGGTGGASFSSRARHEGAGTAAALVAWGADPAAAMAGVVLFSIFTHLMEVPLGALGWLAWSLMPKASGEELAEADAS